MTDGEEKETTQECFIGYCHETATRAFHFPSLDVWKSYCGDHTPLEPHDDERAIGGNDE